MILNWNWLIFKYSMIYTYLYYIIYLEPLLIKLELVILLYSWKLNCCGGLKKVPVYYLWKVNSN